MLTVRWQGGCCGNATRQQAGSGILACYLRVVPAADVLAEEGFIDGDAIVEAHLHQDVLEAGDTKA